jgi:polyhydroxyalkanoate synthesis regulator phasin
MEDTFFSSVAKAVEGLGSSMQGLQGPWAHVLSAMRTKGTDTGAQATQTVEQLVAQTQTALREGRAASAKTMQAMLDGYTALVSGVLIGMSEGLQGAAAPAKTAAAKKTR